MSDVYFDPAVGGDGSTITDDANPATGMANGGHRARFVPALVQLVAVALWVKNRALDVFGYAAAASDAADAAATSAASAAAALDQLDDRWLGAKAADPVVDNDGNPLQEGSSYWNTVGKKTRVFDGAAFVDQTFVPTAASGVSVVPTADVAATDVQAAIAELAAEKARADQTQKALAWKTIGAADSPYNAVDGDRLAVNTSAGPVTVTMPAGGGYVAFRDHVRTFGINALTVGRNGKKIEGYNEDMVSRIPGDIFALATIDVARGWVHI